MVENVSLKLVCETSVTNLEFPTFVLCEHNQFCLQILEVQFEHIIATIHGRLVVPD